ncbi:MAG: hypothetical protein Q7U60_12740, partial [Candidatus Methanoperedens sp.]|nr:hypothetical protein [Candidatus Methanoperedens sp.]
MLLPYYRLKKNEKFVPLYIFLIVAYISIIISKFLPIVQVFTFLFLFLYVFMLFSPKNFTIFSTALLSALLIAISIIFTISWVFEVQIPYIGIISDTKMLVFLTFLYVILTYRIIKSNFEIFQYQRMPYLIIESEDFYCYIIKNVSEFPALDIMMTLEILCPIPEDSISSFKLWLKRTLQIIGYNRFNKSKPDYIAYWASERLDPKDEMKVNIYEEIEQVLSLTQTEANDKTEYCCNEKISFDVIVKTEYSSQDNLPLENPLYSRFRFESSPTGTKLL